MRAAPLVAIASMLIFVGDVVAQEFLNPAVLAPCQKATVLVLNEQGRGVGSAFCIDADGYFATHSRVLSGSGTSFSLVIHPGETDQRVVKAKAVRVNSTIGLGVLRAEEGKDFTALRLAEDAQVTEAMAGAVLGYPFGGDAIADQNTFPQMSVDTAKITVWRQQGQIEEIRFESRLQFDTRSNSGSPGGPLVDSAGAVIGIVLPSGAALPAGARGPRMGGPPAGAERGIRLAIPANRLKSLLDEVQIELLAIQPPADAKQDRWLIDFGLRQIKPRAIPDLKLEITNGRREDGPLGVAATNTYRFSVRVPAGVEAPSELTAVAEWAAGSVRAKLEGGEAKFGSLDVRLNEIVSIRQEETRFLVRTKSGKQHELPKLPDQKLHFDVAGTAVEILASKLTKLDIRESPSLAAGAPSVGYEIIARSGDTVIAKRKGQLPVGLSPSYQREGGLTVYSPQGVVHGKTLNEVRRIRVSGIASSSTAGRERIVPLPEFDRILVCTANNELSLISAETGDAVSTHVLSDSVVDMARSPDGQVVYVVAINGRLHRLNLLTDRWEAQAPATEGGARGMGMTRSGFGASSGNNSSVLVPDAQHILRLANTTTPSANLSNWPVAEAKATTMASRSGRDGFGAAGSETGTYHFAYDPFLGRLLLARSTGTIVAAFRVAPADFPAEESASRVAPAPAGRARGMMMGRGTPTSATAQNLVINLDGRYVFHGDTRFNARELTQATAQKTFPHPVLAATADLVFTAEEYCDIDTGEVIKTWDYIPSMITVSIRGDQVCAYDRKTGELVIYEVKP